MNDGTNTLYPNTTASLMKQEKKIRESVSIKESNKIALLEFVIKLRADGTGEAQQLSYLNRLGPIAEMVGQKDFKELTKKDMEKVFATVRSQGYKQSSINKMIECVKAFWRWLNGLSSQDAAPEAVRWLKREKEINDIRPEDLWTEDDITRIINLTHSDLYKTIFRVAYESGLRPGELRSMRIRDVQFNDDIVRLYVRGKTRRKMGERVIPLVRNYETLKRWVYNHPLKDNPEAWLWSKDSSPLQERAYSKEFTELAQRAKIKKPTNPYILRHSALTRFYKELPTPIARKLAGHAGNSAMVDTYCHLALGDLEDSVRSMNGTTPKKKRQEFETICPKCHKPTEVGAMDCVMCGEKFSTKSACDMDENEKILIQLGKALLHRVENNPELLKELLDVKHD